MSLFAKKIKLHEDVFKVNIFYLYYRMTWNAYTKMQFII